MKYSTWIGCCASVIAVITCFATWITVPSVHLQIGGLFSTGHHNFGKPGIINIICSAGAAVWFVLPALWAKRINIFFCGFNIAWAIRNFILLGRCYEGDCPVRQPALYLLLIASCLMLLMAFVPDVPVTEEKQ